MSSEPSRPTRANPLAIPTVACRETPSSSDSAGSLSWSSRAAVTAACAWSARLTGRLKKAMTASPTYLSMKAPWPVRMSAANRR